MSEDINTITVTIDGIECKAKEGEFILNIARELARRLAMVGELLLTRISHLTSCKRNVIC